MGAATRTQSTAFKFQNTEEHQSHLSTGSDPLKYFPTPPEEVKPAAHLGPVHAKPGIHTAHDALTCGVRAESLYSQAPASGATISSMARPCRCRARLNGTQPHLHSNDCCALATAIHRKMHTPVSVAVTCSAASKGCTGTRRVQARPRPPPLHIKHRHLQTLTIPNL